MKRLLTICLALLCLSSFPSEARAASVYAGASECYPGRIEFLNDQGEVVRTMYFLMCDGRITWYVYR